jgi:carbon storage regulator CsrA
MLALSRKTDEAIILKIDGQIIAKVRVLSFKKGSVKLGFEANENVEIIREELLDDWKGRK